MPNCYRPVVEREKSGWKWRIAKICTGAFITVYLGIKLMNLFLDDSQVEKKKRCIAEITCINKTWPRWYRAAGPWQVFHVPRSILHKLLHTLTCYSNKHIHLYTHVSKVGEACRFTIINSNNNVGLLLKYFTV